MKIGFWAAAAAVVLAANAWASASPTPSRIATEVLESNDLAIDELLTIAMTEEESLRIAAVEVLGEMRGSARARAVLGVVLYANAMPAVRAAAADQLGNLGDGEAAFALALALETERDAEVRDVITANLERSLPTDAEPEPKFALPNVAMAHAG